MPVMSGDHPFARSRTSAQCSTSWILMEFNWSSSSSISKRSPSPPSHHPRCRIEADGRIERLMPLSGSTAHHPDSAGIYSPSRRHLGPVGVDGPQPGRGAVRARWPRMLIRDRAAPRMGRPSLMDRSTPRRADSMRHCGTAGSTSPAAADPPCRTLFRSGVPLRRHVARIDQRDFAAAAFVNLPVQLRRIMPKHSALLMGDTHTSAGLAQLGHGLGEHLIE
jgi:hypothetical protein